MTYTEIMKVLEENYDIEEFEEQTIEEDYPDLGIVVLLNSSGDSSFKKVYLFGQHDVYIELSGDYSSYDGSSFYGGWKKCCREVRPKEVMTTIYV